MKAFINKHRDADGGEPIRRILPIALSTYHENAVRQADPSRLPARTKRDAVLKAQVRSVFDENFGVYGVRMDFVLDDLEQVLPPTPAPCRSRFRSTFGSRQPKCQHPLWRAFRRSRHCTLSRQSR